jgi:hypothetical protein
MHLPHSLKDIIEFHRSFQNMGQRGLPHRYDGVSDTAAESGGLRDLIGMQEFTQDGTVDDAFMRTVGNSTDEHGDLQQDLGLWLYM